MSSSSSLLLSPGSLGGGGGGGGGVQPYSLSSDLEDAQALHQQHHDFIEGMLTAIGDALIKADETLSHLEVNGDLLPTAILRKCHELADGVGRLADDLEHHSPQQQQALAQACLDDYNRSLTLLEEGTRLEHLVQQALATGPSSSSSPPTVDDFLKAIQGTSPLLRDIQGAFTDLSEQDAEDIADAALTLARLVLLWLQTIHSTITPQDLLQTMVPSASSSSLQNSGIFIEELGQEEEEETEEDHAKQRTDSGTSRNDSKPSLSSPHHKPHHHHGRVKVLWPRLGPQVNEIVHWGQEEATKQPILAAALGLAFWPAALGTTIVGGSIVLADHVIQDVYQRYQDGPFLSTVEQGAAQILQAGRLGLVLTTILTKQTWRVVQRQVKRRGGVEQIVDDLKNIAVDKVTHPIESVGTAWNGLVWGVSAVTDTVQQVLQQREEFIKAARPGTE